MTADRIRNFFVIAFVLMFFAYLFGPLILMSISAFNSSAFPRVSPFECFTVEWFAVLARDATLMEGLRNSLIIKIIYQWFNTGGNWPRGSAYGIILLVSTIIFVLLVMKIFKVKLGEIAK